MRRFLWMVCLLMLALSVSGLAAQDKTPSAAPVGPLQVVDSLPVSGEELDLQAAVTIYFDRALDCTTAAGAVIVQPTVEGKTDCVENDTAVKFTPSQPLARGTSYALTVNTGLQGKDGAKLVEPFTLKLNTIGFMTISDVLPANGATGIEANSAITVIFNRPVVPLGIVEEADKLPNPISINPAVKGKGEWLNTSIYIFRPETALAGGTKYTVTVSPDLKAADGSVLEKLFSWSFSTVDPAILTVKPEAQAVNVGLDEAVEVKFNQPMERASAESNFYLRVQGDTAPAAGTFEWANDSAGFKFKPTDKLKLDKVYDAGFNAAGLKSAAGGSAFTGFATWSFATVPLPSIIRTDPSDGQSGATPWGSFTIYFASAMNVKTLKDKITIDPKPARDYDAYYNDYDNSYSLNFPVQPSANYTVSIAPGMEDIYGNKIEKPLVVKYTTAPYEPSFSLQAPGDIGFYNAHAAKTQLFLLHRNIGRLDLNLYSVSVNALVDALTSDGYSTTAKIQNNASTLRSWQMPVENNNNEQRFELLNLGSAIASATADCPGAPKSRLKVSDMAMVISDPDPVTARESAPDGARITSLYKGYQLPIIGGPVCVDSKVWWQVQLRQDKKAWVAEGAGQEYFLDLKIAGQSTDVTVTAAPNGTAALPMGVYLLKASSPETVKNQQEPQAHVMLVATANLTLKYAVNSVLVWATDVQTGAPIPNAPIVLYGKGLSKLGDGTTDANGLLTLPIPRVNNLYEPVVAVLQGEGQFGVGYVGWSQGVEPYEFGQNYNFYPQQYRSYLYTDRPIYRPNQPVYFRGVVREQNDVTYTPPKLQTIPVKIFDNNGQIVYDKELPLTPFGTFNDQFNIADDAPLGYYRVVAQLPGTNDQPQEIGSITFGVAEFRLPEFQVNVTPQAAQVVQGDTIKVNIESKYFFGGSVSNANVKYTVVTRPYSFNYDGPGYYDFTDYNYDSGSSEYYGSGGSQEVASGEGKTDAQGKLTIEVPAELKKDSQSQIFTIEATVTDESEQVVAGRTDVTVHKGLVYIGAQPEEYVGVAKQEAKFNLIAVDWANNGVPNQKIDVKVVERHWSSVQEQDETGRTTWTWKVEEIPVTTGSATTDANGKATYSFTPDRGGVFKVLITTQDAKGNAVVASTTTWVSSDDYVSWRQQNSNRIDLIADKKNYKVGDTAEILITSPWQGSAEALITVERGAVLTSQRVTLTSNSYIYKLPITPEFAPNVYVSVMLVKGVDANNPVAAFRAGLVQLPVDNKQKELTITIKPDKEQAGPRETVNYTVRAVNYKGEPVKAEIGVGLTDLASLSIADPNSGPLLTYYYGQQGLGVRTATPLTINVDQLTQTVLDTIKGGGGGGGEGGIFDIRQDFVDTAFWKATLVTDDKGEATFSVTLPDNLTTWRLDARAVTRGDDGLTLVGQNTLDLISTKPLLIRPVTPRFMVVGDQVTLAAVVNNNTGKDMPVEVSIQGSGLTFKDKASQTMTIPSGGRQRVEWPVTVEDVANIDLTFFANGENGAFTDASKPPLGQGDNRLLPVYKYEVPEVVGTGGLLREAGTRTEAIALPKRFDVTQGDLSISIDPSLAATTIDGLNYLRNYPYQCIEQTVSRFLPNIMTYRALDQLGVAKPELKAQLDGGVNFALQRLYAQQKVDGGWGWFVQDDSNPLTTAYALIGLAEAKNAGFTVSDDVISRAQSFLKANFIVPSQTQKTWRMNRQAFILYALARSGAADVARTSTLYDFRAQMDYYSKAFLALTFNLINPGDTSRSDTLLSDLVNGAKLSATGAHWEENERDYWNWNTDTRTTAIVLDALVKLKPQSDLTPNVVRWLMVARKADAWETTQETAWAVMGLTDWMVTTGELKPNFSYSAALNGKSLTEGKATPDNVTTSIKLKVDVKDMLAQQANNLVIGRTDGAGVLYYTAHLRAFLPVPEIKPLNRGVIVERRYTLQGDKSQKPITEAKVGDVIQVRLTVIAPNNLYYAVIEDPIPAGTEAINPDLKTEQQVGTQPTLDSADPLSFGWGWWWFSNIEFRDQKVVMYSTYLPAGTYEYVYSIRAGLAGVYNVIPATGQEFYFPEVYGRSAGSTFTILP